VSSPPLRKNVISLAVAGCMILFLLQGLAFLDLVGVQHDEALFAGALLPPLEFTHSVRLGGTTLPLMLDSYLGCLKAWLYAPLFALWRPDVYSLRIPALLAAALTIGLVFRLLRRIAGAWAALAACALLAVDTMYLLTSLLDWGPVVLQHLLGVLVMWLAVRFHETGRLWRLALAAFCCGLALWDKAAFLWMLGGLLAAALLVLRREFFKALTWRNALVALICLTVGASPLIYSNWGSTAGWERASGGLSAEHLAGKASMLWGTLNGASLFGYLSRLDPPPSESAPELAVDRASLVLSQALGNPWKNWLPWAVLAAILLAPLVWKTSLRRPYLFTLAALAAAWALMATTARGGGASHHVVLLWPLPHMLVGLAAAALASRGRRAGLIAALAVTAVGLSCLAVTNQYLANLVCFGSTATWSDASYPLARYLERAACADVYALDWGIMGPLRITGAGRLPVRGTLDLSPGWEERQAAGFRRLLSSPQNWLVAYVAGSEVNRGRREALAEFAARHGYREQVRRVIRDRLGRPVFEVLHFQPKARS